MPDITAIDYRPLSELIADKLVGVEPATRPHHTARICALGRRSALCNLCFMLVIV
jgi:hypothetical protein